MIKKTAWFFGTLQCFQTRSDLKLCEAMNLPRYRWFLRDSTFLCRVRKIWVIRFGWTLIPWCVHPIGNKHTSQVCCWRPMVKCRGEAWCRSSRKPWPGRKCSRGGPRGSRWRQVTTNIREKLWMEGQNNGHLQDQIVLVCDKRLEASQNLTASYIKETWSSLSMTSENWHFPTQKPGWRWELRPVNNTVNHTAGPPPLEVSK